VSTFTGELNDALPPDLVLDGPMPLVFRRYYASLLKRDGKISGALGDNWLHNFEMKLRLTNNTFEIVNEFGRVITFTNSGNAFVLLGRQDVQYQFTYAYGSGIGMLADPRSQRQFMFDFTGKLARISDGRGNAHTLAYSGNQLTSVTDGLGRTLTFQYNG